MLSNPFRRKTRQPSGSSSKPGGIRIGLAQRGQQQQQQHAKDQLEHSQLGVDSNAAASSSSSTFLSLPPESDYRTSLIMPHLTRRFTLLRAPDGSMVTPDAMRAQLRAQRARARATGQPGGNFLTEQEEDEIIDQMRQQTLSEQANDADGSRFTVGSGSDGFGANYASSVGGGSRSSAADRIGSLTESLGELKSISSGGGGSLFSGRSSERDNAYLRSLDKNKAASLASPIEEEEEEEEEEQEQEQDIVEAEPEDEHVSHDDVAMPGGFGGDSPRGAPTLTPPSFQQPQRQSQLLSALSPEAFRRVSTALEEVIGIVSPGSLPRLGGVPGEDAEADYEIDAISAEESDEGEARDIDDEEPRQSLATSNGDASLDQHAAARAHEAAGDEADDEVSEDDDVSQRHAFRRETPDSDGASFQSAKEEAGASTTAVHEDVQRTPTLDQTPRLEVMTTPRNAASTTSRAYSPAGMPTTPSSSSTNAPVLSAGAIAARSQRYFPQAGAGVKTTLPIEYASGFRSGPTTPITPNDPNVTAAPSRRQPPPTSLDVQKSINASQEDVLSPTTGGLFPQPPTHDPVLAQRWQQTYGLAGAHDGSSIGGGSESEFERQFEQEPEVDDVWAKVARNLGEEERENGDVRPMSQMPPAEAASQFDGNTVDRLAQIQANLVRSVSQRNDSDQAGTVPSAAPPMPQLPLQSTTTSTPTPPSSDYQQPPISPAKVEKARERARMIAAERTRSGSVGRSTPSSPAGPARGGSSSEDSAWPTSPMGQLSQSNSQRSFKGREVMYDVTSSHRPTSPPPGRSSGGLPTIQDLSALNGAQPDTVHYHMSLSQAVDYAANYFDGERYSDGHSRPFATTNDTQDYGGLFGDSIAEDDEGEGAGATTQSHPYSNLSPRSAQTTWSNPRSPRQDDFGSPQQQHDFSPGSGGGVGAAGAGFNANLVDDVAAQAQAATVALKGPHSADGGPHLTPRRSRVLSKRKNKRNPGKFIGAPELLTTSQYMGHAQPIPEPAVTKKSSPNSSRGDANARRPPVRQASDYRNDPKTMPATLLHRRRSSSFGHSGRLEPTSPAGPRPGEWAAVATPPSALPAAHQRSPPASAPAAANLAAPGTPASTKSTASFGGTIPASSSNGSISRLMSKMRMRKPVEGATTPVQTSPNPSTGAGRATPLRGPSPFGIRSGGEGGQGHGNNGLSADSTLPESGAVRMAGMMPSPSVERGERHDSSQMGQWSGRSAPLANEDSWRASSNAGESTTEAPPAKEGGALLGSPAAIHEDSFGGFLPAWQQQQPQQQASMASQDRTSTASGIPSDTAPVATADAGAGKDANGRASARNTIIRRTLIFPSEAAANEEQRRRASVVSTTPSFASKRKSRRAQGDFDDDEANASYAALLAGKDESPRPSSQIRRSEDGGGGGASRAAMRASRVSRVGGASLRPPSFATSARRVSTATGGADGGSYAGSLYDMYIGPGAGDGDDSIYEGSRPASYAQGGPIGSHIEVTERADGSVVWQVIAGLGNKEGGERRGGGGASADGGSAGKHTRGNSDASQFSFLNRPPRDSYADVNNGASHDMAAGQHRAAGGDERTFTGLLRDGEDDSRSLFQRQRTESNVAAAMKQQRAKQREAADLPLPPWQAQAQQSASSPTSDGQGHADAPDATAAAAAAAVRAFNLRLADSTSETRVVYSNDVELEQLLESLARQHEDGGKFLFDPKQYYAVKRRLMEGSTGGGEDHDGVIVDEGTRRAVNAAAATAAMRPVSRFYREGEEGGGETYDGQEQRSAITSPDSGYGEAANGKTASATPSLLQQQSEAGRRRVEDEIMNLLGQQPVAVAAADDSAGSGGRASG